MNSPEDTDFLLVFGLIYGIVILIFFISSLFTKKKTPDLDPRLEEKLKTQKGCNGEPLSGIKRFIVIALMIYFALAIAIWLLLELMGF